MKKYTAALMVALSTVGSVNLVAQVKEAPSTEAPKAPSSKPIPLRVEVVLSRYQGDKKISSLPYMLSVNAILRPFPPRVSQLKMGSRYRL